MKLVKLKQYHYSGLHGNEINLELVNCSKERLIEFLKRLSKRICKRSETRHIDNLNMLTRILTKGAFRDYGHFSNKLKAWDVETFLTYPFDLNTLNELRSLENFHFPSRQDDLLRYLASHLQMDSSAYCPLFFDVHRDPDYLIISSSMQAHVQFEDESNVPNI